MFLGAALFIASTPDLASGQVIWLGGTGNWSGPWLGNTVDGTIPSFPNTPTSNWSNLFYLPGPADTVYIGAIYPSPAVPVTGTAILNSATTVAGVVLGSGASGGLQVSSGGT